MRVSGEHVAGSALGTGEDDISEPGLEPFY